MSQKKFIGYQSETGTDERGVQIRSSDPISPVDKQVWINLVDKAFKVRNGATTILATQGWPISATIPLLDIDANSGIVFYKSISIDSTFTFTNFVSGMQWQVFINNSDVNPHTVTFPVGTMYQDAVNDPIIAAGTTTLFKFVKIDTLTYCIVTKNMA